MDNQKKNPFDLPVCYDIQRIFGREIMREDGTMMRTTELKALAARWGITFISIRVRESATFKHC